MKFKYHIYATDGFESAHISKVAAERVALRSSKRQPQKEYRICQVERGFTTGTNPLSRYYAGKRIE